VRWKSWYPAKVGERRTTSWFAILPVKIDGEIRWLEWVSVEWQYTAVPDWFPPCEPHPKWRKIAFVDFVDVTNE
jgi:hypothetical protein